MLLIQPKGITAPLRYSLPLQNFRQLSLSFLLLFTSLYFVSAQTFPPVAPVNPPTGGFGIEGTLKATATVGDWASGGGAGFVFNNNRTATVQGAIFSGDFFNNTSDSIFTGSAFSDNPNTWKWALGKPTNKCDINNAMFLATTSSNSKWLILGGDRLTTTGTSYIDFEFLQGRLSMTANGFSSVAADGSSLAASNGRTEGDFVLSMEYSNGGTNATVHYYEWTNANGTWKYVEKPIPTANNVTAAYGATNGSLAESPFGAFGSATYIPYAFVEAAVNIDAILSRSCKTISVKTVFVKTKASDSYNAALKDFVKPQEVNFVFGSAGLNYNTPFCQSGSAAPTVPAQPSGTFSYLNSNGVNTGLSLNGQSGVINLASSTPGTYTVTYQPTGGVCLEPATTSITINPLPSASMSGTTAVCKNAASPFVVVTGSGGTRPYTFTYSLNGGQAQTRTTTGSHDTVRIAVPTGTATEYTYTLTGVADANCSNTASGNAVVTVRELPSAEIIGTAPVCKNAAQPFIVFKGSYGTKPYVFHYKIGDGAVQTRSTTDNFDTVRIMIPTGTAGSTTYYLTKVTDANCQQNITANTVVTVRPLPSAAISGGGVSVCQDAASPFVVIEGSGGTRPYTFEYTLNGNPQTRTTTGSFDTVKIAVPTGSQNTFTYTLTGVADANCSNTASGSAVVTVNGIPSAPSVCIIQPSLCGPATGKVQFNTTGTNYQYTINNGANWSGCPVFVNVPAGAVTGIKYKTAEGCISEAAICSGLNTCSSEPQACANGMNTQINASNASNEKEVTTHNVVLPASEIGVKAFPNPYNDRIRFIVTAPHSGRGSLEIFNSLGQKITTVYQGPIHQGNQTFEFSVPQAQRATLIYVMRLNGQQVSGKLLSANR